MKYNNNSAGVLIFIDDHVCHSVHLFLIGLPLLTLHPTEYTSVIINKSEIDKESERLTVGFFFFFENEHFFFSFLFSNSHMYHLRIHL